MRAVKKIQSGWRITFLHEVEKRREIEAGICKKLRELSYLTIRLVVNIPCAYYMLSVIFKK